MKYKPNKLDKAKVIVTALYNLDKLVTEEQVILWKKVKRWERMKVKHIQYQYELAMKILQEKIK